MSFSDSFKITLDSILRKYSDKDFALSVQDESKRTVRDLQFLISQNRREEAYIEYLTERWARIALTASSYKIHKNLMTPGSVACMSLSKKLGLKNNIHPDLILMPKIPVKAFAIKVLSLLNQLTLDDPTKYSFETYVESQSFFNDLKKLLQDALISLTVELNSSLPCDVFNLDVFVKLLKLRQKTVIQLETVFFPELNANEACVILAKQLGLYANINTLSSEHNSADYFYKPCFNSNLTREVSYENTKNYIVNNCAKIQQAFNLVDCQQYLKNLPFERDALINVLTLMPEKKWALFISSILDLQSYILNTINPTTTIPAEEFYLQIQNLSPPLFNDSEKRSKALLFCIWEIYIRDRSNLDQFKKTGAKYVNYIFKVPTREEKIHDVNQYMQQLVSHSLQEVYTEFTRTINTSNEGLAFKYISLVKQALANLPNFADEVISSQFRNCNNS